MTDTIQGHPAETAPTPDVAVESTAPTSTEPKWYESLPDQLKVDKTIQKYDSQEKALEGLIHSNKVLGKRFQDLSSDEMRNFITPEEMYEIAHSKGLPKSVEEFKSEKLDGKLPPDLEIALKTKALEYGLTPEKLESMVDYQNQISQKLNEAQREQWRAATFNAFGSESKVMIDLGVKALKEFGGEEAPAMVEMLRQTGLGDNPVVIKFLANIGKAMTEDKIPSATMTANSNELASVNGQIKTLLNDSNFRKEWNSRSPAATAKLDALYKRQMELEAH